MRGPPLQGPPVQAVAGRSVTHAQLPGSGRAAASFVRSAVTNGVAR